VSAARVEVDRTHARGFVAAVQVAAVVHDADQRGVAGGGGVVVAHPAAEETQRTHARTHAHDVKHTSHTVTHRTVTHTPSHTSHHHTHTVTHVTPSHTRAHYTPSHTRRRERSQKELPKEEARSKKQKKKKAALHVGVVVVRRGVPAALVHEERGGHASIRTRLEERRLACTDVHSTRAVSAVQFGGGIVAGEGRAAVGGGGRGGGGAEARLERAVDQLVIAAVPHRPEP
jgi:hypothetical protein